MIIKILSLLPRNLSFW